MIAYMKATTTNATLLNPTLKSQLGSEDVVFALACVETYRISHFGPSKYGTPKGAMYPTENSTGDGGFGAMQLTEWGDGQLPSYKQIWNWQENVDGSVEVLKEKISQAKGISFSKICRSSRKDLR